jgi:hypothetical protein
MLSLSPRYDLFRFHLPKTFLPPEIEAKYTAILNKDAYTMTTAIDYLNESIQGISMPGINDLTTVQTQHGSNNITRTSNRLNVEAAHDITYLTVENPLEKIDKEFKVTFRTNNGLLNYFMLYETAFWYACREYTWDCEPVMYIELLNEDGTAISRIKYIDVHFNGIEGLDFNYSKIEREANTFDITFKFNNIDFEYLINEDYRG